MNIRMGKVSGSSLVKAVGFSGGLGEIGTLRIRFDDTTIDFFKVPYVAYRGLVLSRDPAQHYLKNIYGQYDYKKLKNS